MFYNLSHNFNEPNPDSIRLTPPGKILTLKFSILVSASLLSPFHLPYSFFLVVSFTFFNPVYSTPQIESLWPVDCGGRHVAPADPPINQPTDLPRRSHLPLAPPFILPTAAPDWPIASQYFSGVRQPASCYQPWPLTCQCPWVDLWPCLPQRRQVYWA